MIDNNKQTSSPLLGKSVLIIEDDAFLGGMLLEYMKKLGIKVDLLVTGDGAFEYVKKNKPDIIMLDIFIPVVNGLDILNAIRHDEEIKNTKVLVVSNSSESKEMERAKALNAPYMVKALATPASIVENLEALLSKPL